MNKGGVHEVAKDWEPKLRYPDYWRATGEWREQTERREMGFAEAQCLRARRFARMSGCFGKGKNVP